jgi:HPt (histidine-containing phosphotransfer) domain-containing protein
VKKITSLREMEKLTAGNVITLQELLTVFIKEGSSQVQKLHGFLTDENLQEIKNTAHKIKSSLSLIGMETYRPIAEEIEQGGEKDLKKTKQQVLELTIVYKQALEELKIKLEELS